MREWAEDGVLPILWAADIESGRLRRSRAREHQRWIVLRDKDAFMRLEDSAVLVQRTSAPEQPRRLMAAALSREQLASDWHGAVVVENHVNVLRCIWRGSPLTDELLVRVLNTATIDRVYRCITGSVAVSAYELEAIPLPGQDVLRSWQPLSDHDLVIAVDAAYSS